jgi:two-component system LytT family response regulator
MSATRAEPSYQIIIVDDEPLAREGLRDAIVRLSLPSVEIGALCENAIVGLDAVRHLVPDILLLDVAMPVLDGFAMLERLEPEVTPPAVIFVTAYDEHAVRAFDVAAVDFLLKPVTDLRLRAALDRAIRRIAEARALRAELEPPVALSPSEPQRFLRHLVIPERSKDLVIPVDEIEWLEGDTYYVRVHAHGRVRLLRERLSKLESSLDPTRFHRTHRSALVRLDLIREVQAESPYTHSALLSTGQRVPVSRERLKGLQDALRRPGAPS